MQFALHAFIDLKRSFFLSQHQALISPTPLRSRDQTVYPMSKTGSIGEAAVDGVFDVSCRLPKQNAVGKRLGVQEWELRGETYVDGVVLPRVGEWWCRVLNLVNKG